MAHELIIIVILVIFSAFFSAVETAFTALSRIRVRHMVEKKKRFAKVVERLKNNPYKLLSTVLIGNNIVNVAASAIATTIAISYLKTHRIPYATPIGLATGIMTLVLLFFGEITPKIIAIHNAEKIARYTAIPIEILSIILSPIIYFFNLFNKLLIKIIGKKETPPVTEELLRTMARLAEEHGTIKPSEEELIQKIFRFDDVIVKKIMTPLKKIVSIDANLKLKDALDKIMKSGYSRIPVFFKKKINIIGVIYVKDLIKYVGENRLQVSVMSIMRPVFFVKEDKKIDSLLKRFQKNREHMAIIIDKKNKVLGIVTLENILEEIVGDIHDEVEKKMVQ